MGNCTENTPLAIIKIVITCNLLFEILRPANILSRAFFALSIYIATNNVDIT